MAVKEEFKLNDLWRFDGTVGRAKYAILGVSLVFIKYLFDINVSKLVFHRNWSVLEYIAPGSDFDLKHLVGNELVFYMTMAVLSLPFAWSGCVLTIRRLRSAGMPTILSIMFFFPVLNLFLFKTLCWVRPNEESLSSQSVAENEKVHQDVQVGDTAKSILRFLNNIIPTDTKSALLVSLLIPSPFALVFGWLSIMVFGTYGSGVFIALPFAVSMASTLLYSFREKRTLWHCIGVGILSVLLMMFLLILFSFEGAVCIIMAAPLLMIMGAIGGILGYAVQKLRCKQEDLSKILGSFIILVPTILVMERYAPVNYPVYNVTTTCEIDAPPRAVWKNVVAFTRLRQPEELMFKLGIAYPIYAKIHGQGPGAVRHCVFSTGTFVEPITVWNEPRLLRFSVTSQPSPMYELTPFHNIRPPHLDGYLISKLGQFELTPSADESKTIVAGTTWYQNKMTPGPYWNIWADYMIHKIHARVLAHVKRLSEEQTNTSEITLAK